MKFVSFYDKRPEIGDLVWFAMKPDASLKCEDRAWTLCLFLGKKEGTSLSKLYLVPEWRRDAQIMYGHNGRIHADQEKPTNGW